MSIKDEKSDTGFFVKPKTKLKKILIPVVLILLLIVIVGLKDQPIMFKLLSSVLVAFGVIIFAKLVKRICEYLESPSEEEFHILTEEQQLDPEDLSKAVDIAKGVGETVADGSKKLGESIKNKIKKASKEGDKNERID